MAKRGLNIVVFVLAATLPTAYGAGGQQATAADAATTQAKSLAAVIAGDHRSAENKSRDQYRHPRETLEFFGIRPDMTVIEIWPSTGWYTEILAPYLHDRGHYIAAHWDPESKRASQAVQSFKDKLAARPDLYRAEVVVLSPPDKTDMVPAGSVDMVVTFRNIHNWMGGGYAEAVFAAMYRALKPGGVLGVEEHRANTDKPQDPEAKSGYVRQDYAIALAEKAGFVFEAASDVNANPKDTKDYPAGVWTLPPTLREGDKDKARYLAIGESDRFTLRFRKPRAAAGVGEGAPAAAAEVAADSGGETAAPPP